MLRSRLMPAKLPRDMFLPALGVPEHPLLRTMQCMACTCSNISDSMFHCQMLLLCCAAEQVPPLSGDAGHAAVGTVPESHSSAHYCGEWQARN
jgi:hypothetical protein